MRWSCSYRWTAVIALCATPVLTAGEIPGDIRGIIVFLGFDGSDLDDLLDGEVIALDEALEEGSDKEMAVGVAVLLPTTLARATASLRSRLGFEIDNPPAAADFAAVNYTRKQWKEVRDLLEVEAGSRTATPASASSRPGHAAPRD